MDFLDDRVKYYPEAKLLFLFDHKVQ